MGAAAPAQRPRVPIQSHVDLMRRPSVGPSAGFSLPFATLLVLPVLLVLGLALWGGGPVLVLALGAGLTLTLAAGAVRGARPAASMAGTDPDLPPPTPPTSTEVLWVTSLADAVAFLGSCLEEDDLARLRAACAEDAQPESFAWLRERHTARSLAALYRRKRFSLRPGTFSLGGHGRELGHVHVDFASPDGERWWLRRVWTCR